MDSNYGALPPGTKRKVNFDPTINLGHLLTFVGAVAAGISAYSTIDKRQTIQEMNSASISQRLSEQDLRLERALAELRADSKETQRAIAAFNERLVVLQMQSPAAAPKPNHLRP